MRKYILNKVDKILSKVNEPEDGSVSLKEFLIEYDYATKYLSRLLKVRGMTMYMLLFKQAYFEEGNRKISMKLSELGQNLLSDLGKPMSHDVVKRGINDLVKIGIVEKNPSRPGQINKYTVKLPSELRQVQEFIENDRNSSEEVYDDSRDDYYTDKAKRLEILKRDEYKCFYCLCDLQQDNFYLDHIFPRSNGGHNWKTNLVTACRDCNTRKNADDAESFLIGNYRKGLFLQSEFLQQKKELDRLRSEYEEIKQRHANKELS
ncbi:MAG: HNH endonuclease [Chlorobi bacterium]|nr:HNH endonuclease [Chlorobiota bacterium]